MSNTNTNLYGYVMAVAEPRFGQDHLAFDCFAEQAGDMLEEANEQGYELELTQKLAGNSTSYSLGFRGVDTDLLYF